MTCLALTLFLANFLTDIHIWLIKSKLRTFSTRHQHWRFSAPFQTNWWTWGYLVQYFILNTSLKPLKMFINYVFKQFSWLLHVTSKLTSLYFNLIVSNVTLFQNASTASIQECIPVGCVPSAHWLYLVVSARGCAYHACPPATHAPGTYARPLPCTPPTMQPLWTDRYLWKHNLRKLRLWAVKVAEFPKLALIHGILLSLLI